MKRDTSDYLNRIRMYDKFDRQTDEYIRQRNYADSLNAANTAKQKAQTDELIRQNRELLNKKNKWKETVSKKILSNKKLA